MVDPQFTSEGILDAPADFMAGLVDGVHEVGGLFLAAAARGYIAIRRHQVARHREWMIRLVALALAISTVRILMGVLDYALTPALTLKGLVNMSWTEKSVDTNAVLGSTGLVGGDGNGDERFLGTEFNLGLTYRFAPNVAFDLVGAYLFAGDAMNHANTPGGDVKDADDVYKAVARVRFTF